MDFAQALDELIDQALAAEDGPSVAEVIFDLEQAQLGIHMAILQAHADGVEDGDETEEG